MSTTNYEVTGMTCGHCVSSVTAEITKLAGVQSVDVALVRDGTSRVVVSSDAHLSLDDVRAAVDEAGYELVGESA
ncbi:heavy-metal-associated domain-containing protein [Cellulomonas terrae]|uniref:Metal-binding protein n=1 Tax=Cellulomonas terrae TaxID=311234 RepID=A0A511JHC0_9CELL|nr:heavy metal-associated domain-containing protein [Cellulomonas terrae]GEL97335.1 metal-binding protein [Cellulomonas terrae]